MEGRPKPPRLPEASALSSQWSLRGHWGTPRCPGAQFENQWTGGSLRALLALGSCAVTMLLTRLFRAVRAGPGSVIQASENGTPDTGQGSGAGRGDTLKINSTPTRRMWPALCGDYNDE